MWKTISSPNWSPWISGILLSILFVLTLFLLDEPVGTNSAYSMLIDQGREVIDINEPTINWEIIYIIGVFIGALIAAILGKGFKLQLFPEDHLSRGTNFYLTLGPVYSFVGGILVMAGLILAGNSFIKLWSDCLGLDMIVWVFVIIMFIFAVVIGTMLTFKIEENK